MKASLTSYQSLRASAGESSGNSCSEAEPWSSSPAPGAFCGETIEGVHLVLQRTDAGEGEKADDEALEAVDGGVHTLLAVTLVHVRVSGGAAGEAVAAKARLQRSGGVGGGIAVSE